MISLNFRSLTKCHTEKWRVRRDIKTKHWQARRHHQCVEQWRLFVNSMVLPLNAQIGNRIKAYALARYACPKSHGLISEEKLRDKMQKRQIDAVSVHEHLFLPIHTNYYHNIGVCKYFYSVQNRHILFWLLKDA